MLARQHGETWAVTATNNSHRPRTVRVGLPFPAEQLRDALGGPDVTAKDGRIELTVPPLYGRVLLHR